MTSEKNLYLSIRQDPSLRRPEGHWSPVGKFWREGELKKFRYTRGASEFPELMPIPGFKDMSRVYSSRHEFPILSNRILPGGRPEYVHYLRWCGFLDEESVDGWEMCEVTLGKKMTDHFEVFPDLTNRNEILFFQTEWVHHVERINHLLLNDRLVLEGGQLTHIGRPIGGIPDYLSRSIIDESDCEVRVFLRNPDAPMNMRLLLRLVSGKGFKLPEGCEE